MPNKFKKMWVKRRSTWYHPSYHTGTGKFNRPKHDNKSRTRYSLTVRTQNSYHPSGQFSKPPTEWIGANQDHWKAGEMKNVTFTGNASKRKRVWEYKSRSEYNKLNPKNRCSKRSDWKDTQQYWKARHSKSGFNSGAKYGGVKEKKVVVTVKKRRPPTSWSKPVFIVDKPRSTMSVDNTQAQNMKAFSQERTSNNYKSWKSQTYCTDGTPVLPGFVKAMDSKVAKRNSEIVTRSTGKKKKTSIAAEMPPKWFDVSCSDFDEW